MSAADSQVRRKLCHLREFQFSALSQRPLRLSGSISHTKTTAETQRFQSLRRAEFN